MTNLSSLPGFSNGLKIIDTQIFTSSGTWTKNTAGVYVWVRAIGGGGGGVGIASNNFAAFGGQLLESWFTNSVLGSTVTVTIGAGGTGVGDSSGNNGGATTFGSFLRAKGGKSTVNMGGTTLAALTDADFNHGEIRAGVGARTGVSNSATAGRAAAVNASAPSSWPDTGGGGNAQVNGGNYGGGGGCGVFSQSEVGGNGAPGALIAVTWG